MSDLATPHYAKSTLAVFNKLCIPFVSKDENPPNFPQCRPIENFWAQLKGLVYEKGWEATSVRQLKQRINKKISEIDMSKIHNDFSSLNGKLRRVSKNVPYSVIKF